MLFIEQSVRSLCLDDLCLHVSKLLRQIGQRRVVLVQPRRVTVVLLCPRFQHLFHSSDSLESRHMLALSQSTVHLMCVALSLPFRQLIVDIDHILLLTLTHLEALIDTLLKSIALNLDHFIVRDLLVYLLKDLFCIVISLLKANWYLLDLAPYQGMLIFKFSVLGLDRLKLLSQIADQRLLEPQLLFEIFLPSSHVVH